MSAANRRLLKLFVAPALLISFVLYGATRFSDKRTAVVGQTLLAADGSDTKANQLSAAIESHAKTVTWGKSGSMKFIILAMTDKSFTDMALNLYLSSFRRFNISNFLFVGGGKKACERLNTLRIQCLDFWEDPDSDVSNNFGSKEFIRKMNIRTEMILIALRANFSVLHTDLDVVFLRNPMPEIESLLETADMAILWDYSLYNAGFLAIKSTRYSIDVYERQRSLTNASDKMDDQTALNVAIKRVGKQYTEGRIPKKVVVLDKARYLSGKDYFEQGRDFPRADFEDNCPNCTVVHNNWIVSKEAKIHRFKEATMWFLDGEERYYSDERRRYLLLYSKEIENPPKGFNVKAAETEALKNGFKIAAILNRTIILPRFHCQPGKECPLNSWFKVKKFYDWLAPDFRESSFLLSDLVPESISMRSRRGCGGPGDTGGDGANRFEPLHESGSLCSNNGGRRDSAATASACGSFDPTPVLILTRRNAALFPPTSEAYGNSSILDLRGHDRLNESLVADSLAGCKDRVLALTSLVRVEVDFADPEVDRTFDRRLEGGFAPGGYMQLG